MLQCKKYSNGEKLLEIRVVFRECDGGQQFGGHYRRMVNYWSFVDFCKKVYFYKKNERGANKKKKNFKIVGRSGDTKQSWRAKK